MFACSPTIYVYCLPLTRLCVCVLLSDHVHVYVCCLPHYVCVSSDCVSVALVWTFVPLNCASGLAIYVCCLPHCDPVCVFRLTLCT